MNANVAYNIFLYETETESDKIQTAVRNYTIIKHIGTCGKGNKIGKVYSAESTEFQRRSLYNSHGH
jgi:hypothetical protein